MTTQPPPIPYATGSVRPRLNPLALAAMIVGIVSIIFPLLAPVAIVLGIVGMRSVSTKHERGRGFAVTGIATGCVGFVSAVLMLFALQHARTAAQMSAGMSNLRQIGLAMTMYSMDNKGFYPPDLATLAADQYLGPNPRVFIRPGSTDVPAAPDGTPQAQWASKIAPGSGSCSFTYAFAGPTKASQIRQAATTVLVYETAPLPGQRTLVLFVDGHVESIAPAQWAPILAQLTAAPPAPPSADTPVEPQ